ncbi:tyrosine phosphatase family-domain-containing protein [Xylaria intraflava]|nr:tyrosine phosphatase family-domain-containing protein [Xylaria intraflava]
MANAPAGGKPRPMMPESYDEETSRSLEVTSDQNLLSNDTRRDPQTCTKRLMLGRPISAPHHPINFAMVSEGLYRSGYPQARDYPFMESLKLKTIVTLVNKELPDGFRQFLEENQITHKIFDMAGTKKEAISIELMRSIYAVVSQRENYPLLIHCNHGKHRTGCVVGVLRLSNQWDMKRTLDEYTAFAEPKVRETDLKYLTQFELTSLLHQPQPMAAAVSSVYSRFGRFLAVVVFTILALFPLTKLKIQESL